MSGVRPNLAGFFRRPPGRTWQLRRFRPAAGLPPPFGTWIFRHFTWTFCAFCDFRGKSGPVSAWFLQKISKNILIFISFYRILLRFLRFSQKSFSKSVDFPSTRGYNTSCSALVAQLDRVSDYESEGRGFESLPAHQKGTVQRCLHGAFCFLFKNKCVPIPQNLAHSVTDSVTNYVASIIHLISFAIFSNSSCAAAMCASCEM